MNPIANFWQRSAAFIFDLMLLSVVGQILGQIFFDFFASRELIGNRLLGLIVLLAYFGVLESSIGGGQSLGKKLFGIQVVNQSGACLSIYTSLARVLLFWIAPFFAGLLLPPDPKNLLVLIYIIFSFLVVTGFGLGLIYFYIFNRRTRQSLPDIIFSSYVVKKDSVRSSAIPHYWRGHLIIYSAILSLTILITAFYLIFHRQQSDLNKFSKLDQAQSLISIHDQIKSKIPEVANVSIFDHSVVEKPYKQIQKKRVHILSIVILKKTKDTKKDPSKIIHIVLKNYQAIDQYQYIDLKILYGFDFIFTHWYKGSRYYKSPAEWQQQLMDYTLFTKYQEGLHYLYHHQAQETNIKAFELIQQAAKNYIASAMNELGMLYAQGIGVTKDQTKACEWYLKAAEDGNPLAMTNLGIHYFFGSGVSQDYQQARYWLESAIAEGEPNAKFLLALIYVKGLGIKKNPNHAAKLLKSLAFHYYYNEDHQNKDRTTNDYIDAFVIFQMAKFSNRVPRYPKHIPHALINRAQSFAAKLENINSPTVAVTVNNVL